MCKLLAPTPIRESLEELESRILKLDEENQKLELVLQENLANKIFNGENHQIQTLQEIIEDYEHRCKKQDVHIAGYLKEIGKMKKIIEALTKKNRTLQLENNALKGRNYCLAKELESKIEEVKENMKRSFFSGSLTTCTTLEDIHSIDCSEEKEVLSLDFSPKETRNLREEFLETVNTLRSEVKRLEIEGFEEEKEKKVTNFFMRTPIRVPDLESGTFKRNMGLLKMQVLGKMGIVGVPASF